MAVTIALVRRRKVGATREVIVDITGPASYTTGGEVITAAQLAALMPESFANISAIPANLNSIIQADFEASTGGHTVALDRANLKFMYFNGTTQIAATTNLSAVTVRATLVYQPATSA